MLVVLNNKCNFNRNEFEIYLDKLKKINTKNNIVLCPSYIYLSNKGLNDLVIGSQDVSKYTEGAHTGEVSARQLKYLNVKYTIVGHHERRSEEYELSSDISQKIKNLLKEKITPILCIGETDEERINLDYKTILMEELKEDLRTLSQKQKDKIIIAYEPIWCIGKKQIPSIREIDEVISLIKENYPNNKVLYGGGVNNKTIISLNKLNKVDGYLLGKISLDAKKLERLLNNI